MLLAEKKTKAPLRLILIKPSKYDDDGYVIRYWRGVLPSNTLAALYSLTQQAEADRVLGEDVKIEITALDDVVDRIEPGKIVRRAQRGGARVAVCLCGVQTNQYPRAADLARQFAALGVPVLMGGFHVSGIMTMFEELPEDFRSLMDAGVTLVRGEVEEEWGSILRDIYEGRLQRCYDIEKKPDISAAPIPHVDKQYMKKFAYPRMATIDAGRGCPFNCSFCTIINVQGRMMRNRSAGPIADHLRESIARGFDYFFFTDDNFARNKNWEEIFDAMIALREQEGLEFEFMMQVDVLAYRIPRFCEKAQKASCSQVFIGMEAISEANLEAAGKNQNKAVDYTEMVDTWRRHSVAAHAGYIIGFPEDTPESVARDIETLKAIGLDQVSFFMLTPLPGSEDHLRLVRSGAYMETDYNRYDSFHATTEHPKMTGAEWTGAFQDAWGSFYRFDHMKASLLRASAVTYWGLFKNYMWYKWSISENTHPMIAGFIRKQDRTARRPGFAIEGRWAHLKRRARYYGGMAKRFAREFLELQELWLQTHPRRGRFAVPLQEWRNAMEDMRLRAVHESARFQTAAGESYASLRDGARERFASLQQNVQSGIEHGRQNLAAFGHSLEKGKLRTSNRLVRFWDALRFWSTQGIYSRAALDQYWRATYAKIRRGRIFAINPLTLVFNALRSAKLATVFFVCFLAARGK